MKIFIDTNIIIDWLFLKDKLPDLLKPLSKSQQAAIELFEELKENIEKHSLIISFYELIEAQEVIIRHMVSRKLFQNDIPFQYYAHYEDEMREKYKKDIETLANDFLNIIAELNMFVHYLIIDDKLISQIYKTQREYKLPVTDAMVLMTASTKDTHTEVFVTRDERHFLRNKNRLEKDLEIKIVSPQELLDLLRKADCDSTRTS